MKIKFWIKFLFFAQSIIMLAGPCRSEAKVDSVLYELDQVLSRRNDFRKIKINRLDSLAGLMNITRSSNEDRWATLLSLTREYQTYKFDSAWYYSNLLSKLALESKDQHLIQQARLENGITLTYSGLFKEALDTLNQVSLKELNKERVRSWYANISRLHFDMSDFNQQEYYSTMYNETALLYSDTLINMCEAGQLDDLNFRAVKNLRMGNLKRAETIYKKLASKYDHDKRLMAIVYSSLGHIYLEMGKTEDAIVNLAISSIFDNQLCIKETVSLRSLANLLNQLGHFNRAYDYIQYANEDANFYGARHRKLQISSVMPIIENKLVSEITLQKERLTRHLQLITVLSVLGIAFFIIVILQLRRIREADKKLMASNEALQKLNLQLFEANKIKEEYIGYYFNINSQLLERVEHVREEIVHSLVTKNYDSINRILKKLNLKKERKNLFLNFDQIFLKLFPDFIAQFNELFNKEDRMPVSDGMQLNTDLRIFALIRLGVHDNEAIANILGFSINTIYTYKTKIKNKSLIPNDDFESKIMDIRSV